MSLIQCFDQAANQGVITRDEAEQLKARYNAIVKDASTAADARARMQLELEAEAQHRERAALKTHVILQGMLKGLADYRDESGRADAPNAWIATHENFGRAGGFIQDAASLQKALFNKSLQEMQIVLKEALKAEFGNMAGAAVYSTARRLGLTKQKARLENMVRELFGESTGDQTAKAMANAWETVSEKLRVRFNDAGGAIGKLERWGLPQGHDALALMNVGREAWISYMMTDGVLDRDRTVHPLSRQKMTDADLRQALDVVWRRITTDGWSDRDITTQKAGRGALYTQHADHRFLHFKGADAWLAYNKKFGSSDPFSAMLGHLSTMTRDIAHMEVFGPNPNALRNYVSNWMKSKAANERPERVIAAEIQEKIADLQSEAAGLPPSSKMAGLFGQLQSALDAMMQTIADTSTGKRTADDVGKAADAFDTAWSKMGEAEWPDSSRRSEIGKEIAGLMAELRTPMPLADGQKRVQAYVNRKLRRADAMWESMRGQEPVDQVIADRMRSVRNMVSATSLGSAWISSLTDPASGQDARMRLGMKFGAAMGKAGVIRIMTATLKEMMDRGGKEAAVDAMLGLDAVQNVMRRQAQEVAGIDHQFWSGLIANNTLKWGLLSPWTQSGKHLIGRDIMKFMGDLADKPFAQLPDRLKAALPTHGIGEPEWNAIRSTSKVDGQIRPNEVMAANEALGERYLQMILRETIYAVPESTIATRSIITQVPAGTVSGELIRSMAQFKGFGLAVLQLKLIPVARDLISMNPSRMGLGVAFLVTSTVLGAFAMALKDIKDGRDPRKWLSEETWLDWKHWGAAFLQAGGLGIYGDLLFSETNRFGGGLEGTVAGPLVGRVGDILSVGAEFKNLAEGKKAKFGKWGTDLARRDIPYVNHWATSLTYQRLVMDQLQRMADPEAAAAFARAEAKRRRDYGQSYYWSPGATGPRRAPDLSRILSTR